MTTFMNSGDINYQRIEQAIRYLEQNFRSQPDLDEVAEKVHLSPFHFQRLFTEWAGISPKRFLQFLNVEYLKDKIRQTSIAEAADLAGLSSQSRVYDLFTTLEAVTPHEYKQSGAGIKINYGVHQTPFGQCLIGMTQRGVCWLSFFPEGGEVESYREMRSFWAESSFDEDYAATAAVAGQIFNAEAGNSKLHLFVKGTNFQVQVWRALLRIPQGGLTTYQEIARHINNPRALQAVGSAVGSNHIAWLIPCHRVIRKDGILGEYRWEPTRKKGMIGWELARAEQRNA